MRYSGTAWVRQGMYLFLRWKSLTQIYNKITCSQSVYRENECKEQKKKTGLYGKGCAPRDAIFR
jgi:hypothetical protein